jgi:hypothetical protein
MSVTAIVIRSVTDEEQVKFEGTYPDDETARAAVTAQLALCREHMARYNEDVRLLDQHKSDELTAELAEKGAAVTRIRAEIEAVETELRLVKRKRLASVK